MPSPLRLRVVALGLGFVVAAWLAAPGCGSGGTATTTSSGSTTGSGTSTSTGTGGPTGTGGAGVGGSSSGIGGSGGIAVAAEHAACETCLAKTCKAESTACGPECRSIQACLDAVCANLSSTMAADEGACQVHCQSLHPTGKAAHIAFVNCAHGLSCAPPCAGYSFDYDLCVTEQNMGACGTALDACNNSPDCLAYQTCESTCTTLAECLACGADAGAGGEALYEAYELCIEDTCFAEGWLPNF